MAERCASCGQQFDPSAGPGAPDPNGVVAARVDLEHAEREANSLKRFADAADQEDLAEFAATTLALVAELRVGRGLIGEALKGYPRPFKVAVWSAIIEAFAERMRLDIDLPDLPPRTEATP